MKRLIEREKSFMSTLITIKVVQNTNSTVKINEAIEEAFLQFNNVVDKYTRFNEDSELSNLNRNSGKFVKITKEFFDLIKFMLSMSEKTDGAFDPTIIEFLEVYGYDKNYDFSKLENPKLDSLVKKILKEKKSWREIELNEEENSVKLPEGLKIDLGGVGKGYAVDLAYESLKKVSDDFLIDAGGDIRVSGKNLEGKFWTVGLKDIDGIHGTVELKDKALSSSGSWAKKIKQFHHLIDPRLGKPADRNFSTVFVLGETSLITDAWATALFILGEETENSKKEVSAIFR